MQLVGMIVAALVALGVFLGAVGEIGYWVVLALILAAVIRFANLPTRWYPARLFLLAAVLVVVGAMARYEVLFQIYGGGGDAARYYSAGLLRAEEIRTLTVTPLSPAYWSLRGSRWGTAFIEQFSGIVLAIVGTSLRAEFLVFAMLGFIGSFLIVKSYRWVNTVERSLACASLVWMWPSVWFWPSSVGKEALILLSFGLAAYGYVGDGVRYRWSYLLAGLALSFMIRPHVTALLMLAIVAANLLAPIRGRLTNRRVAQIVLTSVLSVVVLQNAVTRLGLQDADLEGVREFAAAAQASTMQGGSSIGAPSGVLAPLQAFVNVWSRPLPWEFTSVTQAAAGLEVILLWGVVFYRRRDLHGTFLYWREHRMLRFAVPLVVGYTLMIGMTFANLGIIARQRAPMFPFLLLLLLGAELPKGVRAPARRPRRSRSAARVRRSAPMAT